MAVLRRGVDRAVTVHEGCEARHGFSFGAHYDPANTFFGVLLAHNDERLAAGAGYPTHPHHEADLVTWVVAGELRHTDSLGSAVALRPGTVQVLHAGTGVEHSEYGPESGPVRFVQAWVVPDALSEPALRSRDVSEALATGRPVLVAAGTRSPSTPATPTPSPPNPAAPNPATPNPATPNPATPNPATPNPATPNPATPNPAAPNPSADPRAEHALLADPLLLRRADAALWIARLPAGGTWALPVAPFVHVYLAAGTATTPPGELGEGDELRLTDEPLTLTAGARGAEVLVWVMASDLRPV